MIVRARLTSDGQQDTASPRSQGVGIIYGDNGRGFQLLNETLRQSLCGVNVTVSPERLQGLVV